jgi:hypothetical protein
MGIYSSHQESKDFAKSRQLRRPLCQNLPVSELTCGSQGKSRQQPAEIFSGMMGATSDARAYPPSFLHFTGANFLFPKLK